jgi:hypothetical protein
MCIISFYLLAIITPSFAANPLGFEIGKASYDDVKNRLSSMLQLKHQGVNKYSGGKMIVADNPELLGYDGLQKVTMIFDNKNILTAVVMRLARSNEGKRDDGFMYAYDRLNEKYLPVFKNLQTTGRMSAGFTTPAQDVHIRMIAARESNQFDLQYLSTVFWQRYQANKTETKTAQYSGLVKDNLF